MIPLLCFQACFQPFLCLDVYYVYGSERVNSIVLCFALSYDIQPKVSPIGLKFLIYIIKARKSSIMYNKSYTIFYTKTPTSDY